MYRSAVEHGGRLAVIGVFAVSILATVAGAVALSGLETRASGERATPEPTATLPPRRGALPSTQPESTDSTRNTSGVEVAPRSTGPGADPAGMVVVEDGTAIAYDMHGTGPALLLLGDIGMTGDDWDPLLLDGLSVGRRVVRMDYRGTGASGGDPSAPVTIARFTEDAAAILDALGTDADVVGYGMGGYVAQLLALDHQDAVRRLVLIGADAGGSRAEDGEPGGLEAIARARAGDAPADGTDEWLFAPDGLAAGRAGLERARTAGHCCRTVSSEAVERQLEAISTWRTEAPLAVRLFGTHQPTLVLQGEEDRVNPVGNGSTLLGMLPYGTLRVVPGTGHGLPWEAGADVASEVDAFLVQQAGIPVTLSAPPEVDDEGLAQRVAGWHAGTYLPEPDWDLFLGLESAPGLGVLACDGGMGAGCVGEDPSEVSGMHSYLGILLGTYRENGMVVIVAGFTDAQGDRYIALFRLGVDDGSPVEVRIASRPIPDEMGRFIVRAASGLRRLQGLEGTPLALHVFTDTELLAEDVDGAPEGASERLDRVTDDLRRTERQRFASIEAATNDHFDRTDAPTGIGSTANLDEIRPKALPVVTLVVLPESL